MSGTGETVTSRTILFELPAHDDEPATEALVTIYNDGVNGDETPTLALRRGGIWGPPVDAYRDETEVIT